MTATTFEQRVSDLAESRPTKKEVARAAIEAEDERDVARQDALTAQKRGKYYSFALLGVLLFLGCLGGSLIGALSWWFTFATDEYRGRVLDAVMSPAGIPMIEMPSDDHRRDVDSTSPVVEEVGPELFSPEVTRVNGGDEGQTFTITENGFIHADENPCGVEFIADLQAYFEYRDWDPDHIRMIRVASEGWEPTAEYTPIDLAMYQFWSDDGPNLRAFIRDQRFGYAIDGMVVQVTDSIRYTVFRCDCGITAIYREVRIVRRPPPQEPPRREPPPSNEIPDAWCVDSQQRRTSC